MALSPLFWAYLVTIVLLLRGERIVRPKDFCYCCRSRATVFPLNLDASPNLNIKAKPNDMPSSPHLLGVLGGQLEVLELLYDCRPKEREIDRSNKFHNLI